MSSTADTHCKAKKKTRFADPRVTDQEKFE